MQARRYAVVALISLTLIPLELSWTRIFSAEFYYTFAFLVLSLAILGLGLGALALRLFGGLDRPSWLGGYLAAAGVMALVGPILVFKLGLDFSSLFSSWLMVLRLLATVLILMSSYFFGGMALALIFKHHANDMPRLYMYDLIGAGIGVLVAIGAMNWFGTPVAAFLIPLPILLAAILVTPGWPRLVPATVATAALFMTPAAESLLHTNRVERAPVVYTHWDALSKIKVYHFSDDYRGINIDNVANSPVHGLDSAWRTIDPDTADWGIDASYLIQQFDSCVFMSLGAGGGSDVVQALVEGATEIHAVEVNPHINYMMTVGDPDGWRALPPDTTVDTLTNDTTILCDTTFTPVTLAEFSGGIYNDPRVTVVTDDARAYVRRFDDKFDVIYSLSSNTWAALASGSFALAENYLFTTEAFVDYWTALTDSGFLMMEHQVYVPRLVTEVMTALEELGVERPTDHFAVYNLPKMRRNIILLSKRPLIDSLRYYAFGPLTKERFDDIHLLVPPANDSLADNLVNRIVTNGWQREADSARIDISPVNDNRPFIAQLGRWRNVNAESLERVVPYAEFQGFPLSRLVMLIILAVVLLLIVPLNLLPYFKKGETLRPLPWLYFFCIGVAFMAVEIILIQKYTLLIGASIYSLATVLLVLLVASGIGSRFARSFNNRTVFGIIVGWLLVDAFVFPSVIYAAGDLTLLPRILITGLLILPVGFFMGMPFPKAALRVGELVDWGFAVNGAASVLGSILVLLVVFAYGFSVGLVLSALVYAVAWLLISKQSGWTEARAQVTTVDFSSERRGVV